MTSAWDEGTFLVCFLYLLSNFLLVLQCLQLTYVSWKAVQIIKDTNHPGNCVFSFCCHLVSPSGAWWQKLRDLGGASPPGHQAPKLKIGLITSTRLHLIRYPLFSTIRIAAMYIPCTTFFAHSYLYYYLLSLQYTFLYVLFYCTFYLYFIIFNFVPHFFPYLYLCTGASQWIRMLWKSSFISVIQHKLRNSCIK